MKIEVPKRGGSSSIPEIDSLYVYRTRVKAKFTHRLEGNSGYRYATNRAVLKSSENEIHIYHRTVEIRGLSNGLTVVTKNSKFREVQRWFNEQIKAIEADDKLFNKYSRAKASPTELGIRYTY